MRKNATWTAPAKQPSLLLQAAREYQQQGVKKRPPLEKFAKKRGLSLKQLKKALDNPSKRIRRCREALRIERDLKKAPRERLLKNGRQPRMEAAKIVKKRLRVKDLSLRTVQRLARPVRDAFNAKRAKKIEEVQLGRAMCTQERMRRENLPLGDPNRIEPDPPPCWDNDH